MKGVCKVLQSIMWKLMTLLLVTFCEGNFSTLICKDTLFFTASENSSSILCILLTYADNARIQSSGQVGHIGMYNGVKSLQICASFWPQLTSSFPGPMGLSPPVGMGVSRLYYVEVGGGAAVGVR